MTSPCVREHHPPSYQFSLRTNHVHHSASTPMLDPRPLQQANPASSSWHSTHPTPVHPATPVHPSSPAQSFLHPAQTATQSTHTHQTHIKHKPPTSPSTKPSATGKDTPHHGMALPPRHHAHCSLGDASRTGLVTSLHRLARLEVSSRLEETQGGDWRCASYGVL